MIVTRIGPASLAKVYGVVYAVFGLLIGLPAGCLSVFVGSGIGGGDMLGVGALGLLAVIIYPLFLGVVGLIGGLLTAIIYNVVVGWVGGVEIEVEGEFETSALL